MTETDFNDYGLTQESNVSVSQEDSPNDFYGGYFNTQENENNKTQANLITQPNTHIVTTNQNQLTNNISSNINANNSFSNQNQTYNSLSSNNLNQNNHHQTLLSNMANTSNTNINSSLNYTNDHKSNNNYNQLPNTYVNVQKVENPNNNYAFNKNAKAEVKQENKKDLNKLSYLLNSAEALSQQIEEEFDSVSTKEKKKNRKDDLKSSFSSNLDRQNNLNSLFNKGNNDNHNLTSTSSNYIGNKKSSNNNKSMNNLIRSVDNDTTMSISNNNKKIDELYNSFKIKTSEFLNKTYDILDDSVKQKEKQVAIIKNNVQELVVSVDIAIKAESERVKSSNIKVQEFQNKVNFLLEDLFGTISTIKN